MARPGSVWHGVAWQGLSERSSPPAPLHHVERGSRCPLNLDCGFRRNDGRLGVMEHAPTQ